MNTPEMNYICDTNIWVRACLGKVVENFFKNFGNVTFADGVENEILKWSMNKDRFEIISSMFEEHKGTNLSVIYLNDIDLVNQKLIKRQLKEFGFESLDNSKETIKNLGEYLSISYAYFLEIPFLQTEDVEFYESIDLENRFKGIEIVTWNDIACRITQSDKERIQLNKLIEQEQIVMNSKKPHVETLESKLARLQQKYSR
ncbi:hypothetical protein R6Z02_12855 [Carnobacterium maltaromaticum]|uniref:hypothetical protein n=1 Tax=Carnobacterium maltaromaticum TaxID=2751 RepID=UPI00298A238E|nr:hypothetical protein [Carnobacterium maltaromaticum]MDW5524641.1 hypothetical protein [Carnobacterium maltaromaticum]